jgi:hypothetical protein
MMDITQQAQTRLLGYESGQHQPAIITLGYCVYSFPSRLGRSEESQETMTVA